MNFVFCGSKECLSGCTLNGKSPQSLDCVKFSLSKERDLFRLACNACWEILECVEWGTVVLLQLSDCIEQQVSCNEAQHVSCAFFEQL